jgi:DNA replication licensing factor MCM7
MTARQLLSILRLSQALARLKLSALVTQADVEEAIRLIHSSKSSLEDEAPRGERTDAISDIFGKIINPMVVTQRTNILSYAHVEATVVKKGYSIQQLQITIKEYEQLGILQLDEDGSHIIVDG